MSILYSATFLPYFCCCYVGDLLGKYVNDCTELIHSTLVGNFDESFLMSVSADARIKEDPSMPTTPDSP